MFRGISWLVWRGKAKDVVSNGSSGNSPPDLGLGLKECETVKARSQRRAKVGPSSRKVKRKWKSREERRIDKEYDIVLVPSDGVCLSETESDDSDWSIGWLEPHAPDFQSDNESDDSFAVLVPCYRHHSSKDLEEKPSNGFFSAAKIFPTDYSVDGKNYMEQWLSSLQNF